MVRPIPCRVALLLLADEICTHRQPLEVIGFEGLQVREETGARVAPSLARVAATCALDSVHHVVTSRPRPSGFSKDRCGAPGHKMQQGDRVEAADLGG